MQRAAASKDSSGAIKSENFVASRGKSKRQRLSPLSAQVPDPATPQSSDLEAISAALAVEEAKRREVIAKQAAEAGETQWVLEFPESSKAADQNSLLSFVVAAGAPDPEADELFYSGRTAFGNFKRKVCGRLFIVFLFL